MNSSVDQGKGLGVECFAQDVGTHVRDERHVALGHARVLRAENCVVRCDVQKGIVRIHGAEVRDVIVIAFLGAGDNVDFTCVLGLFDGFGGPSPGVGVGRLAAFRQEIHGRR